MLDFDQMPSSTSAASPSVTKQTTAVASAVAVTQTARVVPNQSSAGYLAKPVPEWNWSDLRDYIIDEVQARHGAQVRDPKKEAGICKGFIARWGIEQSVAIAKAAFEVHAGMWRNAPITITRFTKGSDPYFAEVIASNLR